MSTLSIRIFEKGPDRGRIDIWLCDDRGEPLRKLEDPIGHPPGRIDWERTMDSCRLLGEEGLEFDLVLQEGK